MLELKIRIKVRPETATYGKRGYKVTEEIARILQGMGAQIGQKKRLIEGDGAALRDIEQNIIGEWLVAEHNNVGGMTVHEDDFCSDSKVSR